MQDTPPRLQITDPNAGTSYSPISWMAVTSAALGGFFIVATLFMGFSAYMRKQPLLEGWLLAIAALAILLAFVARRQILASEGTLVGLPYCNFGWWVGLVGFLGYTAYQTAIEFSFRREVDNAFKLNWAKPLADINQEEFMDPALYNAVYMTLPQGVRGELNRNDMTGIDRRFGGQVMRFRGNDLIRLAGRNRGNITFSNETIRDWSMKGTNIECSLAVTATCPEGEFQLLIPMNATTNEQKIRQWMMVLPDEGYIKQRKLTEYGWWVEFLEMSGADVARRFMSTLSTPGKHPVAFNGFIKPDGSPEQAEKLHASILKTFTPRAAVGGNLASVTSFTNTDTLYPIVPDWEKYLNEKVFAKPNGVKLTDAELQTFRLAWHRPNTIVPGSMVLKSVNYSQSQLNLSDKTLELRVPIDIVLGQDINLPSAARGLLTLELLGPELAQVRQDLTAAKAKGQVYLPNPPDPLKTRQLNWRIVKITSNLQLLQPPKAAQGDPVNQTPGMH